MLHAKDACKYSSPPLKRVCVSVGIKDSTGSESDGGDSSSLRSDTGSVSSSSEIQPKKVRGFGFGDIFKDQPIKLRPRSLDMDSEGDKVSLYYWSPCILMKQIVCAFLGFYDFVITVRPSLSWSPAFTLPSAPQSLVH